MEFGLSSNCGRRCSKGVESAIPLLYKISLLAVTRIAPLCSPPGSQAQERGVPRIFMGRERPKAVIGDRVLGQGQQPPPHPYPVLSRDCHCHRWVLGSVGTGSSGHVSPGQRFWPGQVVSRVSVTDPVSDPVFVSFARIYCCYWEENTPPWNLWDSVNSVFYVFLFTSSDSSNLLLSGCLLFSHCSYILLTH